MITIKNINTWWLDNGPDNGPEILDNGPRPYLGSIIRSIIKFTMYYYILNDKYDTEHSNTHMFSYSKEEMYLLNPGFESDFF